MLMGKEQQETVEIQITVIRQLSLMGFCFVFVLSFLIKSGEGHPRLQIQPKKTQKKHPNLSCRVTLSS